MNDHTTTTTSVNNNNNNRDMDTDTDPANNTTTTTATHNPDNQSSQPSSASASASAAAAAAAAAAPQTHASGGIEYLSPEGLRIDGRRPHEVRKIRFRTNLFSRADGSCYYEQGNTKVLVAVYGPRQIEHMSSAAHSSSSSSSHFSQKQTELSEHAIINCEYSMATFSTTGERRTRSKGDRRSTEISLVIKQTLEAVIMTQLFPRTSIHIFMQVLQADGGTRCACLNAATLALIDAGIPMRDFVVSCAAGMIDGAYMCDLNYMEDSAGGPDLPVAYLPQQNKISLLQMDSKLKVDQFERVLETAVDGCKQIYALLNQHVKQMTQATAEKRGLFS